MLIFPETQKRVEEWQSSPETLGVVLVGSKSRGYNDEFSDDDLEVVLTDEAASRLKPVECSDHLLNPDKTRLIYDAQYIGLSYLQGKAKSNHDLDHWPYEKAQVLFDRDEQITKAVQTIGRMDADFRAIRLRHSTVDLMVACRRAKKTLQRNFRGAGQLIIARGAKALARLLFALESRWVPLDHWLEPELATLNDPTKAGAKLIEALVTNSPQPLEAALQELEERLSEAGVPRPTERLNLFFELVHPSRLEERSKHGLY